VLGEAVNVMLQNGLAPTLCRACPAHCPIVVTVKDGRAVKVTGDADAPLYEGYTCVKGRALPEQHYGPQRLLHSMKRGADGVHSPIPASVAMDEIAHKVSAIVAKHGPRAVALYFGTGVVSFPPVKNVAHAWMKAIGSPMFFSVNTIDKPGSEMARAFHGTWAAGHPTFEQADAWLLVGCNPVVSKSGGFPTYNPAMRLKEAVIDRGMKLVVIDPRSTKTARRAHIHLQCRPGNDPAILAAFLHVIIAEKLYDQNFVTANVVGFESLKQAVTHFAPATVAERAGIGTDEIVAAARVIAAARHCGIFCGTGPSFATHSSLTEYLALCLTSLCGHWARAGDVQAKPNILLPPWTAKAQAHGPIPARGFGEKLRVRGLEMTVSGLACAALADEILTEGEGQVRALFVLGGNPMMAFPDQQHTFEALKSLELLVTSDFEMTATAKLSHYVIAPRLTLETPSTSFVVEALKYHCSSRGIDEPYGHYAPAVVEPPAGSDLIDDWELYYGLAQRMALPLRLESRYHHEAPPLFVNLDMTRKPSTDELLEAMLSNSRIPLETIKSHLHGYVFPIKEIVQPADPGHSDRLDVGNPEMMEELAAVAHEPPLEVRPSEGTFLLIPQRLDHVCNSQGRVNHKLMRIQAGNPAGMHPSDMAALGLKPGMRISIQSRHGTIVAIVEADETLRTGTVSLTHCFGRNPDEPEDVAIDGASVARLLAVDDDFEPRTGIPRMGALPVRICAA
jgi:anaerobic selenocysteine-containing dehydrogenase